MISKFNDQATPAAIAAKRKAKDAMPFKRSKIGHSLVTFMLAVACVAATRAGAQTASASLSGIVGDATGARIPGASVVLVNQASKDKRTNVSNGQGVFNFSGLTPGTYTLTVTEKSFETFEEKGITLHPGDTSELPPVPMKLGAENVTIVVDAHDAMATDGEVNSLITSEDIKHLATEGRDVTELVKILPGFALQPGSNASGGLSNAAPDTEVVGPGGALGNYAAVGSPSNGVGLISDGANVQDPGAGGASTQTINMDMVEEVKVSTSNFGADTAKGPVVINAVGKAGGSTFHGSLYIITRLTQLNSNDWLLNDQGIAKPPDRYLYPGGSIGGPIMVPGTRFNHDKKLLFLVGAEDYVQRNAFSGGSASSALRLSTVPTDAMRGLLPCPMGSTYSGNCANFSPTAIGQLFNVSPSVIAAQCTGTGSLSTFANYCSTPTEFDAKGNPIVNGSFPAADIDPGAQAYLNIFPHQNRQAEPVAGLNGTQAQPTDGFDRIDENLTNYNLYQVRGRIDYNASQNNKFYAVYQTEQGRSYEPYTLYYNPNYNNGVIRDPSLITSGTNSQTGSANYVRIFGPTLTNEVFAAVSYFLNPFGAVDESKQTLSALGYPYSASLLNTGSKQLPQLAYSSGVPLYLSPDFSLGASFSRKYSVDFGDNVTKVYRQHTIKVGFYFERTANNQRSALGATQGSIAEYGTYDSWPNPSGHPLTTKPGNTITDFENGFIDSFTQQNENPIEDLNYKAIDGFVTDSWKATRSLTLTAGVRFDHLGPWTDPHGVGAAFWYPQNYYTPQLAYGTNGGVPVTQLPGITWHGINPAVPAAVQLGRWAFVSPRAGFAFDPYGGGRTVINGGVGMYRSHDSWSDYVNAVGTGEGLYSAYVVDVTLAQVNAAGAAESASKLGETLLAANSPSFTVADPTDNQQPLTTTYSVGVNQALRHAGNLIVNYVGNQSSHLLLTNGFASNVNAIKLGGLFEPDPNPYSPQYGQIQTSPDTIPVIDDYRPYPFYNGIYELRHALHSSYHSLQTTWSKWNGPFHYNLNYTWSKALGERGVDSNTSAPDATNFRNDYGIAAFDRTHVFNASYSYTEGRPYHGNRFVGGALNGWELSGITNLQSGPNLQAAFSNNFGLTLTNPANTGAAAPPTDNKTYLGTPDVFLQPIETCNPSINLQKGQFVNGSCLTLGPPGVNGPFRYPYLRGPAYLHSDLSAQKTFHLTGKKEVEFRFAAFNFLNHPLTSLVAATANPLKLVISGPGEPANSAFGVSEYKEGRRICEMALHYNF